MPDTRYYVVRHDRIWLIKFEDEEYGPYETQDEALRLASDAAEQLERHGASVEVLLVGLSARAGGRARGSDAGDARCPIFQVAQPTFPRKPAACGRRLPVPNRWLGSSLRGRGERRSLDRKRFLEAQSATTGCGCPTR